MSVNFKIIQLRYLEKQFFVIFDIILHDDTY